MSTTHGRQPNVGKGTSSPAVPRQTRVPTSTTQPKTTSSKLTSSSSSLSRNPKPTGSTSPSLNRGRSFDNKSSPSNAPLQKSQSSITRSTKTTPVVPRSHVEKPLVKSQTRSSSMNHRQGIGTVLNKKPATSNVVVSRKVKSVGAVKAPVIADEIDQVVEEGSTVTVDSDHDHDHEDEEQQGIREEEEQENQTDREEEEEEEVIDEETNTHIQMGEEKEEQINMNEEDIQNENKIETSPIDDLPMDVEEHIKIETIEEPIKIETNADPPMGEGEQIKIVEDDDHPAEEDQVHDDPIKENEGEIETEINPEEVQEKQKQEPEPQQEGGGGEKFLKATEIMKLMEAQTSGKDLTSASPRQLVRGGSGINRGSSFNKKEPAAPAAPAADYNDVIEETASKLISEKRRNKVLALAGAFETVISLQQD